MNYRSKSFGGLVSFYFWWLNDFLICCPIRADSFHLAISHQPWLGFKKNCCHKIFHEIWWKKCLSLVKYKIHGKACIVELWWGRSYFEKKCWWKWKWVCAKVGESSKRTRYIPHEKNWINLIMYCINFYAIVVSTINCVRQYGVGRREIMRCLFEQDVSSVKASTAS